VEHEALLVPAQEWSVLDGRSEPLYASEALRSRPLESVRSAEELEVNLPGIDIILNLLDRCIAEPAGWGGRSGISVSDEALPPNCIESSCTIARRSACARSLVKERLGRYWAGGLCKASDIRPRVARALERAGLERPNSSSRSGRPHYPARASRATPTRSRCYMSLRELEPRFGYRLAAAHLKPSSARRGIRPRPELRARALCDPRSRVDS